jgi:predicted dehydrogenase
MGEVCEVHAYSAQGMPFYSLDDTYVSSYCFENGRIGRLLLVLGARLKQKFRFDLNVYGREGTLRAALGRDEVVQNVDHLPGEVPAVLPVEKADSLALEIAHVVECVRGGRGTSGGLQPLVDVVEGAKGVAVCLATVRSAREGRPVTVDYSFAIGQDEQDFKDLQDSC